MLQTASFTIHLTPQRLSASHLREPESRTQRYIATGLLLSLCLHILFFVLMPAPQNVDGAPPSGAQGPLVVRLSPSTASPPPSVAAAVTPPPSPPPSP
ncbi:MAG: hypothetical protein LH481_05140, partial [Burkholderiales bacterium]|nr:hypothetical protein [Burkholderiales bacterium]